MTQSLHDEIVRAARLAAQETSHSISLREYVDQRFTDINQATALATKVLDARMEHLNEFRAAMGDQARQFIVRVEHDQVCLRIEQLEQHRARMEGRSSVSVIVAAIGLALSIVSVLLQYLIQ